MYKKICTETHVEGGRHLGGESECGERGMWRENYRGRETCTKRHIEGERHVEGEGYVERDR